MGFNASVHGETWEKRLRIGNKHSKTLFSATRWLQDIRLTLRLQMLVCFPSPLSLSNHFHRFQNPIIAKWLPLLFHQLRPKSDISTDACKENCPCGKTSKPPHCSDRPCDSAWLPVGRINPGVRIFSLPQLCCCLIGSKTVENVSVLRKGE